MKTLFLTLTFLFSFLSFSQKIIIHVFERQEMISFSKTSIDSVFSNPDIVNELDNDYRKYVIDLDEKTSTYFVNNISESLLPIEYQKIDKGVFRVNIIEGDFDYGLIINTNIKNQSVTWFWFTEYDTTIKIFTNFYFENPS